MHACSNPGSEVSRITQNCFKLTLKNKSFETGRHVILKSHQTCCVTTKQAPVILRGHLGSCRKLPLLRLFRTETLVVARKRLRAACSLAPGPVCVGSGSRHSPRGLPAGGVTS